MTGGWIPPQATAPIPGSLGPKIMPGHLVGHMRGRLLLPAEGFGIGPGKPGAVDGQVERRSSWCDPVGRRPVQVRASVRLVASVCALSAADQAVLSLRLL